MKTVYLFPFFIAYKNTIIVCIDQSSFGADLIYHVLLHIDSCNGIYSSSWQICLVKLELSAKIMILTNLQHTFYLISYFIDEFIQFCHQDTKMAYLRLLSYIYQQFSALDGCTFVVVRQVSKWCIKFSHRSLHFCKVYHEHKVSYGSQ